MHVGNKKRRSFSLCLLLLATRSVATSSDAVATFAYMHGTMAI